MTFVYLRGYWEYISHFLAQVTHENEEISKQKREYKYTRKNK